MESGTTAVTALLWEAEQGERHAVVSMVGDSVAYLVSSVELDPALHPAGKEAPAAGKTDTPSTRQDPPSVRQDGGGAGAGASSAPSSPKVGGGGADAAAGRMPNAVLVVNPTPHKPVGTEADRIRCAGRVGARLPSRPRRLLRTRASCAAA